MGLYTIPELPYPYDALEPFMDEQTVKIHHTQIHQAYVDRLNHALEGTPDLRGFREQPIEDVLWNFGKVPAEARAAVRNFGGGHANHRLLWSILSPRGGGEPGGELAELIAHEFGSVEGFRQRFTEVALEHFGSGWVWLVRTRQHLVVYALPNEDSPLATEEYPLLGLDLWEHAYFRRHDTRREDYVASFWDVLDWDEVNRRHVEGGARAPQAAER